MITREEITKRLRAAGGSRKAATTAEQITITLLADIRDQNQQVITLRDLCSLIDSGKRAQR